MFLAWKEFRRGKRAKPDVQLFERFLEDNLFELHNQLKSKTYQHSEYTSFYINDPKLRKIHKAEVLDRVIHHAVYRVLYPIFNKGFICDSYSCRIKKGTHKAVYRLERFTRKVSKNYKKPCFALKCDIKKFFVSVDQKILLKIIGRKIQDDNAVWLIKKIVQSFPGGLPLGNLTSQLFANIYLNELDQFIKHKLKLKFYLRYCDDFVILDSEPVHLNNLVDIISEFLENKLKLALHQDKIIIRKLGQGIDFLGYIILPHYRVLRTKTKRRMLKQINDKNLPSYLGLLKHSDSRKIRQKLFKIALSKWYN